MAISKLSQQEMLDAGVHFGHLKKKWNPKMLPYIFMERKGIHIIDITERKKNEDFIRNINFELENQIKEKTRQLEIMYQNMENFSYSLSYDTNSPLQNIESSINFLLQNIQSRPFIKELIENLH